MIVRSSPRERIREGLSEAEVETSRRLNGRNVLTQGKRRGFFSRFISNLGDPIIRILLCALAANIIFMFQRADWVETVGIAVSVFLATFISTASEYGSETAFARLKSQSGDSKCRVRRGGGVREIHMSEVVVGDIVLISAGEKIPADGIILSGSIGVDQSAMTGENREVEKYPNRRDERHHGGEAPLSPSLPYAVFGGCTVLTGDAEMEVLSVGDKTFIGEISKEVQIETRESPLKIRLAKLAGQISRLGYIAAVLVAGAYLFDTFVLESGFRTDMIMLKFADLKYLFGSLLHAFTLGLTVIVVAVPEGLPMMIAVVLSSNIRKMVKDCVLVRKPVGIEAAGSMNILFTDKTGTLTEGKLGVSEIIAGGGESFVGVGKVEKSCPRLYEQYVRSACLNTLSQMGSDSGVAVGGNATDRAMLNSLNLKERKNQKTVSDILGDSEIMWRLPFDSAVKFSASSVLDKKSRQITTYIKGAPEKILPYIVSFCTEQGDMPFSAARLKLAISERTVKGGRVILCACFRGSADMERIKHGDFPPLTLICSAVLDDKIRKEARRSVLELRGAGISVVMITGDNVDTARTIAEKCSIIGNGVDICLTGEQLSRMTDTQIKEILPRLGVVARALPTDKSRLVRIAQERELVVGMTGDGINDAPALKIADIGFAMGDGTDVAREAGDIIILDNNLASIVKAVLYGRNIFKSIRKFITLQLTMNVCAVGVSMICPFIGFDAPVTVVQMLWINIIMDTLGGLAFAGETASPTCMKERPKRRDEPILNGYMMSQVFFTGFSTVALFIAFLKSPSIVSRFRTDADNLCLLTAFFALFIFASVFNCFNSRSDRLNILAGISKNKPFMIIMPMILIIQLVFVYIGGAVLRTEPLTAAELGFTFTMALSVFGIDLFRKILLRLLGKRSGF